MGVPQNHPNYWLDYYHQWEAFFLFGLPISFHSETSETTEGVIHQCLAKRAVGAPPDTRCATQMLGPNRCHPNRALRTWNGREPGLAGRFSKAWRS